jgi:hypothetical protein
MQLVFQAASTTDNLHGDLKAICCSLQQHLLLVPSLLRALGIECVDQIIIGAEDGHIVSLECASAGSSYSVLQSIVQSAFCVLPTGGAELLSFDSSARWSNLVLQKKLRHLLRTPQILQPAWESSRERHEWRKLFASLCSACTCAALSKFCTGSDQIAGCVQNANCERPDRRSPGYQHAYSVCRALASDKGKHLKPGDGATITEMLSSPTGRWRINQDDSVFRACAAHRLQHWHGHVLSLSPRSAMPACLHAPPTLPTVLNAATLA